jgi:hypothetical protein
MLCVCLCVLCGSAVKRNLNRKVAENAETDAEQEADAEKTLDGEKTGSR